MSYRIAVDRITRQIGAAQLQSLTALQVEALDTTLLKRGGSGGRPLAPKTVRNCHIVLRRALADAERLGLVSRNPAAAAKAVSAPRAEQKTWSSEEIQRFFDAVAGERLSMAFVLLRLHDLRHSYATLALKAGEHPKVVSERLGRSTIAITLDLYSHVAQGLDADAAELVASRIYGRST